MKLSVVIVNYNVKYYLEQCLDSLYKALKDIEAEVFVVDNASSDGSDGYIKERFPSLPYTYNSTNVGFSCANNQAIRQAKGEYILLLNPDTLLPEETLRQVIRFMDSHADAGSAGVKMITSDGSFLPESKRRKPSPLASVGKLTGLYRLFPDVRKLGGYYCTDLPDDQINIVEVLAGAFMMLRRSALNKVGLLDENFFMYGEDIDLSCRLARGGFHNYYLPYPILHYKGESTNAGSYRHVRVFYDAMLIFFRKEEDRYNIIYRNAIKAGIYLKMYWSIFALTLNKCSQWIIPSRSKEKLFLVLGKKESLHIINSICKQNHLSGKHQYIEANEESMANGHGDFLPDLEKFTHVVYDTEAYSYSKILSLLALYKRKGVEIGLYNKRSQVLVTPQKCYAL